MKHLTPKDWLFVLIFNLVLIFFTLWGGPFLAQLLELDTLTYLLALYTAPLLASLALCTYWKTRSKKLWPAGLVLLTSMVPPVLGMFDIVPAARVMERITGDYNTEATGFAILFFLTYTGGLLLGWLATELIWKFSKRRPVLLLLGLILGLVTAEVVWYLITFS